MSLLGVSVDTDCERAGAIVERFQLAWPQVCEGSGFEGEIAHRYNIQSTPVYFVIAPDGTIAGRTIAAAELAPMIRAAMPGAGGGASER